MEQKICVKCLLEKPLNLMACKRKNTKGDQLYKNICKVCDNIRIRDKRRGTPKESLRQRRAQLKRNYNMTIEDYDSMHVKQKGLCFICKRDKKLSVDHCHKTGNIRALLCNGCNVGLGQFEDNIESLKAAIEYLSA